MLSNTAQYTLVRLLSGLYKNLCVVGDDDQSIYGWRGANIRNILEFEKDFSNVKVIKLEQNYRSTKTILEAANQVIHNNFARKQKRLWTEISSGALINYEKTDNTIEEAKYVVDKIKDAIKEKKSYKDIAILYRTNAQSRNIEEQLILHNIPHRIFGGFRFYERREVRDILAYLRAVYNPFDDVAYRRIINVPKRGIGDLTIEKISTYANQNEISFASALKEVEKIDGIKKNKISDFVNMMEYLTDLAKESNITKIFDEILDRTGYVLELEAEKTDEACGRVENIRSLVAKASEFETQSDNPTLSAFLEEVALVADMDTYEEDEDTVSLMTLHSSKGLEFPTVFIIGFEEGVFPSYRSISSGNRDALEEERRLCYVGITRAKEKLYITSCVERIQNGYRVNNSVSRFLKEIPKEYVEEGSSVKPISKSEPVKKRTIQKKENLTAVNSYFKKATPTTNNSPDFEVGDSVRQMKYGVGIVKNIQYAGADYEVTIEFESGEKKFMANLSKLKKV